ncbi:MAG: ribonuclease HII [Ruminococcaceae bacterium]|nr:ribonuclease HII [Oscillospiraceae bacterium]
MLDYSLEQELWENGYEMVCGVDEAGRGPLCGPVVAAAVILPRGLVIDGLNDSKKISPKKRDALYDVIIDSAVAYAIEQGSVEEINSTNILEATMNAMRRAVSNLAVKADFALVDGNIARNFPIPARPVVSGDARSPSIAAASILAKVTRDRLCIQMDEQFPMYGIAKHKGYGTKDHMAALRQYGAEPSIYRTKFIRFLNNDEEN